MNTVEKRTPQEFAKNYPLAPKDGRYPNIAVGNITEHNGRYIVNLCLKTVRSNVTGVGTQMSFPIGWGLKVKTGQHMDVLIEDGYVKKLLTPMLSKTISVIEASNEAVVDSMPNGKSPADQIAELALAKKEAVIETPVLTLGQD